MTLLTHSASDVRTDRPGVLPLSAVGLDDLARVGGKNASLGEMLGSLSELGVSVPDGFATTADAFRDHMSATGLTEWISEQLQALDVEDTSALAATGARIRARVEETPLAESLADAVRTAFAELLETAPDGDVEASFAVRSSATAEDLPDASFAGQQDTYLNVRGIDNVLDAVRMVFASLFTDRAIAYRVHHGFVHDEVAISVGVQRMVRSDLAAAGVMFTLDTESGFEDAVFLTSAYGLGEGVVQGAVDPDEYTVHKPGLREGRPAILRRHLGSKDRRMIFTEDPRVGRTTAFEPTEEDERGRFSLADDEVTELARIALAIEDHYGRPMDIEWGKDGADGSLHILQARPETVASRRGAGVIERHHRVGDSRVLSEGRAIGQKIGTGAVRRLTDPEDMHGFEPGDVLVAPMTDPDWEPIMKRAAAIVTDRGGRTCHAAIIARELGIPAVVGTGDATQQLSDGQEVTVSCADGETGLVFEGILETRVETIEIGELGELDVDLMLNLGNPDLALSTAALPSAGVGLARMEFVINRQIGIHPLALLHPEDQSGQVREEIARRTSADDSPREFFVRALAEGVATIAAAFSPRPVIVRLSDFKSNEYAGLVGGAAHEPDEENPMIGFRGASRYLDEDFAEAFALECEALRRVREDMGLTNLRIMIPFVRTPAEAEGVVDLLARNGLERGKDGLQVVMMCEIPANALNAGEFLEHVDGFSIGSNDLTQLTLGIDRDSSLVAGSFDERDPAVLHLVDLAIDACRERGKYVGICGQAPSDHPELAQHLRERGISSISLNPDTIVDTWMRLTGQEAGEEDGQKV
ncbi:phosphoenolpyruvate synthase [Brachybacterium endophyticum]|uniref:Phosphoenolpyruvate synthase n=1 Tax=Brachybacterium endophyticum TaxID=2182385 RepID=A0A2U2RPD5_9MICO|nr:phosphoenolpyruvate synthase [Brachybacterium endophyticum]PWH07624.1 phosphoenolpyruvate synthase [Brachybacterium endophyticum]